MEAGTVWSSAWVEATPSYLPGDTYEELGLPNAVVDILEELQDKRIGVFERPFKHQSEALQKFFVDSKDLIISTGTGSGKTEIFLYSILGLLASEGERGRTTSLRAMRTLILYPMNALVADQLSRLRKLFGSEAGASALENRFGRRIQFGMYTGRTPYHGLYDSDRNRRLVEPVVDYFCSLRDENPDLYADLRGKGRIRTRDIVHSRQIQSSLQGMKCILPMNMVVRPTFWLLTTRCLNICFLGRLNSPYSIAHANG
jgi:ATP-dependent helicase YprA (DUF1998 family)